MSKVTLEFTLPEEKEDAELAMHANALSCALHSISQEVFRPARKHGYSDESIRTALDKCSGNGEELVALLEKKFWEILNEYGVGEYT